MKLQRRAKILELIAEREIGTQEELLDALEKSGFRTTQATVSRDIKDLRLIKHMTDTGSYRYVPIKNDYTDSSYRVYSILSDSVIKVDFALNTVVVKCYTGMAQAACAAVDSLEWEGLVGTIAGDDTIFVLMRTEADAAKFVKDIHKFINKQVK